MGKNTGSNKTETILKKVLKVLTLNALMALKIVLLVEIKQLF